MSFLEEWAEYASSLKYSSLAADQRDRVVVHVVDTVGAMVRGALSGEGRFIRERFGRHDGVDPARAGLDRVIVPCAVTRLTEVDDIHMTSCTTPGSVIVPVALFCPAVPADDRAILDAIVTGYDLLTGLGEVIHGSDVLYRGVWPTYFCAAFGAAACAARLLHLSSRETAHALSIALTLGTGTNGRINSRHSSRWLTLGHAARAGCFASWLAGDGFTGDLDLLSADWVQKITGVGSEPSAFRIGAGRSIWRSLSLKPFCSAKQAVAAVTAFGKILAAGISGEQIRRLLVKVPRPYQSMISREMTADHASTVTNAPYLMALKALEESSLYQVEDRPRREALLKFAQRIEVKEDPGLLRHFPEHWPGSVEVETVDGHKLSETVVAAPGDPEEPFDLSDVRQKYRRILGLVMEPPAVENWLTDATVAVGTGSWGNLVSALAEILFSPDVV